MRSYVVFVVLIVMMSALGWTLARRPRAEHRVAVAPAARDAGAAAAAAGGAGDGGAQGARDGAVAAAARGDGGGVADGGARAGLERALRVVGLGWELLAPGVIANRGAQPTPGSRYDREGLDVYFAGVDSAAEVERALANGGATQSGADVAVLPLPTFVASYERLRALAPEVFFVVGWSRGREGVAAHREVSLQNVAPSGEVRLAGAAGDAATLLALFVLQQAGVPLDGPGLSHVRLVPPASPGAAHAPFAAIDAAAARSGDDDDVRHGRRLLLTTADASRLVPIVAIAPHGFVERHPGALRAWARVWLAGTQELAGDVPAAARRVASVEGAPEALVLLQRLGRVEWANLRDNARVAGLAGRGAVTLDQLFVRDWRLWRAVGVLTTPAPDASPLSTATIAALVRADASLARAAPAVPAAPAPIGAAQPPAGAQVLLVHRATDARLDEARLVEDVGLLAGVFERAPIRLALRGDPARARAVLTAARDRFDLAPTRLFVARGAPAGGAAASVDVLSLP